MCQNVTFACREITVRMLISPDTNTIVAVMLVMLPIPDSMFLIKLPDLIYKQFFKRFLILCRWLIGRGYHSQDNTTDH